MARNLLSSNDYRHILSENDTLHSIIKKLNAEISMLKEALEASKLQVEKPKLSKVK